MKQARRRRAKPAGKKKKARKAVRLVSAYDVQDLLVKDFIEHPKESTANIDIEDAIYCATASLSILGYNSGYAVGRGLFLKSGRKDMLPEIMEKLGFGKVLYNPSTYKMVITSFGKRTPKLGLGENIHIFESGIIAGYVSASANMHVVTNETHCSSNRSNFCQFITFPDSSANPRNSYPQAEALPASIYSILSARRENTPNARYHLLASMPLLEEPLLGEVAKLLYACGEYIAHASMSESAGKAVGRISDYFGIKAEVIPSRSKKVIKLKYSHYNSSDGFLKYSIAMLLGFVSKRFDGRVTMNRSTGRKGNYAVTIESKAIK
ncbi:MAG: hypothetical protein KGH50_03985 [Candidatus Micrarchaeota archaeon]|nr:hypothetical protein [Candidatus Micrarchaeota archaeon]